jgi:hypothetical protein
MITHIENIWNHALQTQSKTFNFYRSIAANARGNPFKTHQANDRESLALKSRPLAPLIPLTSIVVVNVVADGIYFADRNCEPESVNSWQ